MDLDPYSVCRDIDVPDLSKQDNLHSSEARMGLSGVTFLSGDSYQHWTFHKGT